MVVSDEIIGKFADLSTFCLTILRLAHNAVMSVFWNHRWKMEGKSRPSWSKSGGSKSSAMTMKPTASCSQNDDITF